MASTDLTKQQASGGQGTRRARRDLVLGIALPYLLILPALLVVFGVLVYPLAYGLGLSFTNRVLTRSVQFAWIGFQNYAKLLAKGSEFWHALGVTLHFASADVACEFIIGLAFALLLNRDFPGRNWLRVAILIPMMIPPLTSGLMWRLLYDHQFGFVCYLIRLLGAEPPVFLGDVNLALYAVVATEVWRASPFMVLSLLAALQAVPAELQEAARVDGAGTLQIFRYITLPSIAPVMVVALLFRTVGALRTFDLIYLMTGGGPGMATEVLSLYIHRSGFRHLKLGFTSAGSVLIFIGTLVVCVFYLRILVRRQAVTLGE